MVRLLVLTLLRPQLKPVASLFDETHPNTVQEGAKTLHDDFCDLVCYGRYNDFAGKGGGTIEGLERQEKR
ncbi:hypothetical protein [Effusibacillus consociatus]|uniref:hypothetical protein n=1 Tax=Effusibacillus consociatus TaxID=1117041 RepID=UPI0036D2F306